MDINDAEWTYSTEFVFKTAMPSKCHAGPRVKPLRTDAQVQHVVLDCLAVHIHAFTDDLSQECYLQTLLYKG